MPPQVKVSKDKIKNTAFEMTCENGFESVTARKLAEKLGCSTQPIFRVYENMDALKCDLYEIGTEHAREIMYGKSKGAYITYLDAGMAYIGLAQNEAHLFRLIGAVDDLGIMGDGDFLLKGEAGSLTGFLPDADDLSEEKKGDLISIMWSLIHGIAALVVSGRIGVGDDKTRGYITTAYHGLLYELKGK